MSFNLLHFDRIRFAGAMVIPYHVKVNRMNGSNPESDHKKNPWQSTWTGGSDSPRPVVSEVNRRDGLPLPVASFVYKYGFRVRSAEYLLMHS
jgi:hypothetical protein